MAVELKVKAETKQAEKGLKGLQNSIKSTFNESKIGKFTSSLTSGFGLIAAGVAGALAAVKGLWDGFNRSCKRIRSHCKKCEGNGNDFVGVSRLVFCCPEDWGWIYKMYSE